MNGNSNSGQAQRPELQRGHSDGPQSLPSLKASGLLDSWNNPRTTEQKPSPGLQQRSPRRSPPISVGAPTSTSSAGGAEPDIGRSVQSSGMPVGLPWLANESR